MSDVWGPWSSSLGLSHILHHESGADEAEEAGQHHGKRGDQEGVLQTPPVGEPAEEGGRNCITQCVDEEDVDRKGHGADSRVSDVDDNGIERPSVEKKKKLGEKNRGNTGS